MPQSPPVQFRDKVLEDQLAQRARRGHSRGMVAQQALARYFAVCHHHTPTLHWRQWCAIFDALNGCAMLESWSPRYIAVEVQDARGLGQKWEIDQAALVQQLQALLYAECVAIADAAERFWASDLPGDDGWHAVVEAIVGTEHVHDNA